MAELDKLVEMAEKVKHEAVTKFRSKDWRKLKPLQQKLWRHECLRAGLDKLKNLMDEEIRHLARKDLE